MEYASQVRPIIYNYTDFELLLHFIDTIEPPIFSGYDKRLCIERSYAHEWATSLLDKFNAVAILYNEVLDQIPKWKNEYKQIQETGYGRTLQETILLVKYETFLNSIYSFCENISYMVRELYPKANLPTKFYEQKTKHLENISNFDSYYAKLLESTDWYDEVHSMRSECVHYLSGFIFISEIEEPGYLNNKPYSKRKGHTEEIEVKNIEKHVREIYSKLYYFVMKFSRHLIEHRCNKDKTVGEMCMFCGLTGIRTMTLNDYFIKNPPRCEALEFNCPVEDKCTASNKPSER
jgi:hypothetical protein